MKKNLIPTLAACLLLGGCMTGIMWERMAGDQYEFAADESDNITAFAVATADSSQLKKGSLILVGFPARWREPSPSEHGGRKILVRFRPRRGKHAAFGTTARAISQSLFF